MRIKNTAKVLPKLIKDIKGVVGSMYSLNAPYAIGYVFNTTKDGKTIAQGMFFDRGDDKTEWEYFLDYTTGILSKTGS